MFYTKWAQDVKEDAQDKEGQARVEWKRKNCVRSRRLIYRICISMKCVFVKSVGGRRLDDDWGSQWILVDIHQIIKKNEICLCCMHHPRQRTSRLALSCSIVYRLISIDVDWIQPEFNLIYILWLQQNENCICILKKRERIWNK